MKKIGIYSRILLLLMGTGLIFLLFLISLYLFSNKQEDILINESREQFENEVNSLIKLKTGTIRQVVFDYTYWDDFVNHLNVTDTGWFNQNISTILKTYRLDYACVYDTTFLILHEAVSENISAREFISMEVLAKLKEKRFMSFFQITSDGLMEISCATIHPETDPTHLLTQPKGYLILAKFWDNRYLEDLALLSGAKINLLSVSDSFSVSDRSTIFVFIDLSGCDGKPVMRIGFTRTSEALILYHTMSLFMMGTAFCIIFITLLIYHFTSRKWINRPLKLVTNILKSENYSDVIELQKCKGEFQLIGSLFSDFIDQKEELKHSKNKAEESDRLKSAFLANMSHEIRTPMNGILGFTRLLKSPDLSEADREEFLKIVEKSGVRLLTIINNLVDIAKIEAGQMEIAVSTFDVNEKMEFVHSFFKREAELKGLKFTMESLLPSPESIIRSDPEKLVAIMTNLVRNAIKFTHEGFIKTGYKKEGHYLEFFVQDTGEGIRPQIKEVIFERFMQGDRLVARNNEGTGLGLSISKAYVEMLGGRIRVESEYQKGSTFYFTIPYEHISENKSFAMGPEQEQPAVTNGRSLKVLIAEDDEISAELLVKMVEKFSHKVIVARTGVEALEICQTLDDIDLVLMDIRMPVMDGYETTRKIREFDKNLIIIAQTAYAISGDKIKSIEAGCTDYITKPISEEKLARLIKKYF